MLLRSQGGEKRWAVLITLRGVSAACCAEMVELDGMLVSAAAAERRKFFSALLQRAAKRRRDQGGGTLSLVLGMLGLPASGDKTAATAAGSRAPKALDAYQHLSPELKAKMAAALAAKAEAAAAAHVPQAGAAPLAFYCSHPRHRIAHPVRTRSRRPAQAAVSPVGPRIAGPSSGTSREHCTAAHPRPYTGGHRYTRVRPAGSSASVRVRRATACARISEC